MSAKIKCRKLIPNQSWCLRGQYSAFTHMAVTKAQFNSTLKPLPLILCRSRRGRQRRSSFSSPHRFMACGRNLPRGASIPAPPSALPLHARQRVPRAVKSLRHSSASPAPLARRLGFHVIQCATMDRCASVARYGVRFSRIGYGDRGRTGSAPHDPPC